MAKFLAGQYWYNLLMPSEAHILAWNPCLAFFQPYLNMCKARYKILKNQGLLVKKVWGMQWCLLLDQIRVLEDLTVLMSPLLSHWTFSQPSALHYAGCSGYMWPDKLQNSFTWFELIHQPVLKQIRNHLPCLLLRQYQHSKHLSGWVTSSGTARFAR